jgi:dihydrofolate reductase
MKKIIVAAKSKNHVIGVNNDLAWSMPADLKHYHDLVRGSWAIMGRTTYESSYEPVPLQKTIVVTRNEDYRVEDASVKVVHSIEDGFLYAKKHHQPQVFILGGGHVYEQAMALADEMVLTEIEAIVDGDTFFPEIDLNYWQMVKKIEYAADPQNPYDYAFVFYNSSKQL